MTRHDLKCWPPYFQAIVDGSKNFEVRINDRGFQSGDILELHEWDPRGYNGSVTAPAYDGKFTGRQARYRVGYVLSAAPRLPLGHLVVMSLLPVVEGNETAAARIAAALSECDAMDRSADADWPEPSRSAVFTVTSIVRRALTGDTE